MDETRFAAICRALGSGTTRRGLVGVLAGLVGLELASTEAGRDKSKRGQGRRKARRRNQNNGDGIGDGTCGARYQPCCPSPYETNKCEGIGLVCSQSGNLCVDCGYFTEPCCVGGNCDYRAHCVDGRCQACGDIRQPCCDGSGCRHGKCTGGTCQ